jgi:hypothetical protein
VRSCHGVAAACLRVTSQEVKSNLRNDAIVCQCTFETMASASASASASATRSATAPGARERAGAPEATDDTTEATNDTTSAEKWPHVSAVLECGVLLEQTIAAFRAKPSMPKVHDAAQKRYAIFCRNRTAELYTTFFSLVGVPDLSGATFVPSFKACVPFPGKKSERDTCGMAKSGLPHGVVRYEYIQCVVEECRVDGREHGLRVVCVQTGDIWIRLFSHGKRLAQIVLCSDFSVSGNPKPIDDGGLKQLKSHLHLVLACFKAKATK